MVIIVSSNCVYYDEYRECLSELFFIYTFYPWTGEFDAKQESLCASLGY